jgi:antitoxin VapB
MELPGEDALIRSDNGKLIIEPLARPSLLAVLAKLEPIADELPEIDDLPAEPVAL